MVFQLKWANGAWQNLLIPTAYSIKTLLIHLLFNISLLIEEKRYDMQLWHCSGAFALRAKEAFLDKNGRCAKPFNSSALTIPCSTLTHLLADQQGDSRLCLYGIPQHAKEVSKLPALGFCSWPPQGPNALQADVTYCRNRALHWSLLSIKQTTTSIFSSKLEQFHRDFRESFLTKHYQQPLQLAVALHSSDPVPCYPPFDKNTHIMLFLYNLTPRITRDFCCASPDTKHRHFLCSTSQQLLPFLHADSQLHFRKPWKD